MLKTDPATAAVEILDILVRFTHLYYLSVVIDDPLWTVKGRKLQSVEWCRFKQLDSDGNSEWWFDIVHSPSFDTCARELTNYYSAEFKRTKARPVQIDQMISRG